MLTIFVIRYDANAEDVTYVNGMVTTVAYPVGRAWNDKTNGFSSVRQPSNLLKSICFAMDDSISVLKLDQFNIEKPRSSGAFGSNAFSSINLPEQPFAITGDACLTSVRYDSL